MTDVITYTSNGDSASGYLAIPRQGTGPGLLVIQEWWGLVDHIRHVCDRFAAEGFVALAPDLYHGKQTKSPDEAGKLLMALDIARAGRDLRGAAQYLLAHETVTPRRVGAVGFCMGGQLALYAAMEHGDVIRCAVDFYGIHPKVTIDPLKLRVPVLGHFGARDSSVPVDHVKRLAAQVKEAGGSFETHFYDADHAFFNDTRPTVYHPDHATTAWERTVVFLKRNLK